MKVASSCGAGSPQTKVGLILAVKTYVVSRLVLSPIVTQPAAQQQHRVCGWCGPGHYVVTPTRVEVELGSDNIVITIQFLIFILIYPKGNLDSSCVFIST